MDIFPVAILKSGQNWPEYIWVVEHDDLVIGNSGYGEPPPQALLLVGFSALCLSGLADLAKTSFAVGFVQRIALAPSFIGCHTWP